MGLLNILVVFGIILVSMILHELMHGVVAYWLGDSTAKEEGRLSLNPLEHLDPFMSVILPLLLFVVSAGRGPVFGGAKPVPVDKRNLKYGEWGMALVAIAGPLTNFLLALICFLVGYFTGVLYSDDIIGFIMTESIMINLGFMVFNLIPIPPLDGSRLLYALAPDNIRIFMEKIERGGVLIVYIMILFFGSIFSSIMAWGISGILSGFYWLVGL